MPAERVRIWERIGSGDPAAGAVRSRQTLRVHAMSMRLTCGKAQNHGFCTQTHSVVVLGAEGSRAVVTKIKRHRCAGKRLYVNSAVQTTARRTDTTIVRRELRGVVNTVGPCLGTANT